MFFWWKMYRFLATNDSLNSGFVINGTLSVTFEK